MNICLKGREMLLDLQRSDFLPPWDEEGVRTILSEVNESQSKITEVVKRCGQTNIRDFPNEIKVSIAFNRRASARNRRYLNSYLTHRLAKIRSLRWETSAVLPDRIRNDILSSRENDYYTAYSRVLSDYCTAIDMDLTTDLEPPKDLLIEVRVIKACGEIMTENGPIHLDLGSTHFLRRTDVEQLIRQGQLKHVQSND